MIRNILKALVYGPLLLTVFLVLAGVLAGVVGGLAGWENVVTAGEAVFDFGAVGLVAWLCLIGIAPAEGLDSLSDKPRTPASSRVAAIGKSE
jgi:hypothetical protein